jgi:hypothetical protein
MKSKNESDRGQLIKMTIKSFVNENPFLSMGKLGEKLQEYLNSKLKFETKVSNIDIQNGYTFCNISFKDNNGLNGVIDFTINND